jgi:nitroreductase
VSSATRTDPPPPVAAPLWSVLDEARWAPSVHNVQPWGFAVAGDTVEVRIDRLRALPAHDPHDRELTASVGAVISTIEVAAAGAGLAVQAQVLPEADDPDLAARLHVGASASASDEHAAALAAAIRTRHTFRGPFAPAPLDEHLLATLRAGVGPDVHLAVVEDPQRRGDLAALVAEADRAQFGDPRWRRELALWTHPRRDEDGMPLAPGSTLGTRLAATAPGEPVDVEVPDPRLVLDAPAIVVLATDADRPRDWLAAGRALQRLLLAAAAVGVQAGYLNQVCQVAAARRGLRYLIDDVGSPQAVVRFGRPTRPIRRTGRRPLASMLIPPPPRA